MKNKLLTLCLFVAFWGAASAQQELTPPKFNGADVEYFMRRLVGEFEKVAVERFKNAGGVVHVRFYVEPDGKITIGDVAKSPDERLTKEVIRVIRNSRGKWTPRKVRGVPQRTAYELRMNFIPEGH